MFERSEPALKILCGILAVVLVWEVARLAVRHNPVGHLMVPALPELPAKTNAVAEAKGTNGVAKAEVKKGTNGAVEKMAGKAGTNSVPQEAVVTKETGTNAAPIMAIGKKGTNEIIATAVELTTNATNIAANTGGDKRGTNKFSAEDFGKMGTNAVAGIQTTNKDTNVAAALAMAKGKTNSASGKLPAGRRNFGGFPGQMGGEKLPDLPPLMQARIDKIVESEIMAQLTRPQPTGLIGIAGKGAMVRTASGQTGYVKEGDELGGLKLLKVGVNRALVVEDGKTNELMIFSGIGGETLLPKQGETNNETITKTP